MRITIRHNKPNKSSGLPKNGFFGYDRKDRKTNMILKHGIVVVLALVAIAAFVPFGNKSCASGIAPQTCDTEVWKTMEFRARMEAEREIMQNQNLIFKPDSILAYTCFDKFAEHAAQHGGRLFTHTTYWGGKEIIPWGKPDGMDHAMTEVVLKSMDKYIQANFPYDMLGGRGQDLGGGEGLKPYVTSQTGKGDYACNVMNNVWKVAKCVNFVHNDKFQDTDGFYPYADMKGHDGGDDVKGYETLVETRQYPTALKCAGSTKVFPYSWKPAYDRSRNEHNFGNMNRFYEFSAPLKKAYEDVRKKIEPAGMCGDPIFTGITVIQSAAGGGQTHKDGVCTNPGCVFAKSGRCVLSHSTIGNDPAKQNPGGR
jgi:hypothetical protein